MKTKEYTRKAIDKYNDKFDRFTLSLPKGTLERIRGATEESANAFCRRIILEALDQMPAEE